MSGFECVEGDGLAEWLGEEFHRFTGFVRDGDRVLSMYRCQDGRLIYLDGDGNAVERISDGRA